MYTNLQKNEKDYKKKDAGCWMLDAGYWILDTGCWMLDAKMINTIQGLNP
ncbi:MAG: hypothetical protein M0Q38_05370 [Bacteroidales bacterium]|jgi:hypothetical protein|nr:hypothetical protein [Bacteroidales bacterium]